MAKRGQLIEFNLTTKESIAWFQPACANAVASIRRRAAKALA
ncbi:hypothetical protein [Rhizobium sullae]|nr:hypothetical protein [Rhizobium sullae]